MSDESYLIPFLSSITALILTMETGEGRISSPSALSLMSELRSQIEQRLDSQEERFNRWMKVQEEKASQTDLRFQLIVKQTDSIQAALRNLSAANLPTPTRAVPSTNLHWPAPPHISDRLIPPHSSDSPHNSGSCSTTLPLNPIRRPRNDLHFSFDSGSFSFSIHLS
jgi:hypothetical protein